MISWKLIIKYYLNWVSNFFDKSDLTRKDADTIVSDTLQNCDDGELYLEDTKSESILLDDNKIKSSSYSSDLVSSKYSSPSSQLCNVSDTIASASFLVKSDLSKKLLTKFR